MTEVVVASVVETIDALVQERASCNATIEGAKSVCDRAIEAARVEYATSVETASKRKFEIELALSTIYEKLGIANPVKATRTGTRKPRSDIGKPRGPRGSNGPDEQPSVGEFTAQPIDAAE